MAAQNQIVTPAPTKGSFKKYLPGIIFAFLLTAGVAVGVFLVGRQQIFQPKASTIDQGSLNNLSNCSNLQIHPDAKSFCSSFCTDSGCTLPSAPQGVCEIRRFHSVDNNDPVVNDNQTGFVNTGGGNLGFTKSCGAEQIDVGCYTDNLNQDGVYNDGFKTVAYAWKRYSQSCDGQTATVDDQTTAPDDQPSGDTDTTTGLCSDWCASDQECQEAGGQKVENACTFDSCSTGSPCLAGSSSSTDTGSDQTPPAPEPTPKIACGDTCTSDDQCVDATTGVATACREGQCVNLGCYEQGGKTTYGTRCDCQLPRQCGSPCGGSIGLCDTGLSCTYRARSQCSSSNLGVCVPRGSTSANRGPMQGVPLYEGEAFERRQCGHGTADPNNNYVYHPSFPNHAFSNADVLQFICNPSSPTPEPTPTPAPAISAQCLEIKVFDTNGDRLTQSDLVSLKPGDQIQVTVASSATLGTIDKARFRINGSTDMESDQKKANTNDYVIQYIIPQDAAGLSIEAEIHHDTLGWL